MLEAEASLEMAVFHPVSIVVIAAMAKNFDVLRIQRKRSRCCIEYPQIPVAAYFVRTVAVNVAAQKVGGTGDLDRHTPKILLDNGRFGRVDRANGDAFDARPRGGKGNRG